ncbi:unnamed protein product [Closterium sp. NIES-54]
MLMLLSLTTTRASTLRSRPATTSPTASTAATPSAASTAATRAPTAATSPTAATTSTASTTSTTAPTTAPTATSTTTAATSTTPATLALAAAALRTSRSSTDVLRNRDVCSSSRGEGGGKGRGGAPLKEGRARSATSSTYSNCTSLSCEEMLLEEVYSEGGGVKGEKVVPDRAKRVREARDYEVEGDEHGGLVRGKELSRDGSVVASVASAQSRKLQAAERNYLIHDKEMLAIIHAFKLWRCYLVGADVTVRMDHKSLQYLRAQPNLNPRQIRWLDYMESHFTYRIT